MKSLRLKLILAIVPLVILISATNYLSLVRHEEDILRQETRARGEALASSLALQSAYAIQTINEKLHQSNVNRLFVLPDVQALEVVNDQGIVMAHDDPTLIQRKTTGEWYHSRGPTLEFHGRGAEEVLECTVPIVVSDKRQGTVRLVLSLQTLQTNLAESKRYLLTSSGLFLLLVIGGVAAVATWWTRPLREMASVAGQLGAGQLAARSRVRSRDEVGTLAGAFNEMASRLELLVEQEREKRQQLQGRVGELLSLTERVQGGDLNVTAPVHGQDEISQVARGFNQMVDELRKLLQDEKQIRATLERSKEATEEANRQLQEMDKQKTEFLNKVSHELRTPLTSVKAFSELLLDNPDEEPGLQAEFLGIIHKETERLTHLINNLLDLSRIEAGRMRWKRETLDLAQVIDEAYRSLQDQVERKSQKVYLEVPDPLSMEGDPDRLSQMAWNLISNAVKFTPPGGEVRLKGVRHPDSIEFVVEDTGVGIPPEHHENIFEKFWQVPDQQVETVKGSGLGLAVVKAIVEAHKGTIKVDSDGTNGTRFSITLPVSQTSGTLRVGGGQPAPSVRVLVCSDKEQLTETLRRCLESDGHVVQETRRCDEVENAVARFHPDAIFLDVFMEDGAGFDLFRHFRQSGSSSPDGSVAGSIPIWLLSLMEGQQAFCPTAQDFFGKPINNQAFLASVARLSGKESDARILVVDDDEGVVRSVSLLLTNRGYKVSTAHDGIEGVVRARDLLPDLVIVDIYMPQMNGFEVIRRLRQRQDTAQIPIIVLTASDIQLDQARALGDTSTVSAITVQDLEAAVRGALAQLRDTAD